MAENLTEALSKLVAEIARNGGRPPGYIAVVLACRSLAYYRWDDAEGAMHRIDEVEVQTGPALPAHVLIVDAGGKPYYGAVSAEGEATLTQPS